MTEEAGADGMVWILTFKKGRGAGKVARGLNCPEME